MLAFQIVLFQLNFIAFSNLAMSRDHSQHILQFYEERSLRNLVFLYLPIQNAPQSVITFHINQSIEKFQQENRSFADQIQRLENSLDQRDQTISKLEASIALQAEVIDVSMLLLFIDFIQRK